LIDCPIGVSRWTWASVSPLDILTVTNINIAGLI
jgi:hypothetical protein